MSMDKIQASKEAVNKMLFYYNQALVASGCPDVKKEMATEIPKMINLSSDQAKYVMENVEISSMTETLKNAITLIEGMYVEGQTIEDVKLVVLTLTTVMAKLKNNLSK